MIEKAPDAYRTISEVAEDLDLPQHVLRFWETRFAQIKPLKRGGGRRYYRPDDVELLKGIRHLLYGEGYTIKGVQRILKEQGPKAVQAFAHGQASGGQDEGLVDDYAPVPAPPPFAPAQPAYAPAPPQPAAVRVASPPPPAAPVYAEPARQEYRAPEYRAPEYRAPEMPQPAPPVAAPAPVHYAPPPQAAPPQSYAGYAPAEFDPPAPVPPPQPPRAPAQSVSYMRGGLLKPVIPAEAIAPLPASVHQGYSVRKPKLPIPQPDPEPLDAYGASQDDALPDEPYREPVMRTGLSDESRRALQSAMFELTECRRVIERITAARDR